MGVEAQGTGGRGALGRAALCREALGQVVTLRGVKSGNTVPLPPCPVVVPASTWVSSLGTAFT